MLREQELIDGAEPVSRELTKESLDRRRFLGRVGAGWVCGRAGGRCRDGARPTRW